MVKSSGWRPFSLHHAHRATFSTVVSAPGIPEVIDAPAPSRRTGSDESIISERRRPGDDARIGNIAGFDLPGSMAGLFTMLDRRIGGSHTYWFTRVATANTERTVNMNGDQAPW